MAGGEALIRAMLAARGRFPGPYEREDGHNRAFGPGVFTKRPAPVLLRPTAHPIPGARGQRPEPIPNAPRRYRSTVT